MGAITFSSPSGRASTAMEWMSPVQAVFAFFVAPPVRVHAISNKVAIESSPAIPTVVPRSELPAPSIRAEAAVPFNKKAPPKQLAPGANAGRPSCLKILREFEPGKCRSSTGRLIISGRMVDVCAALDRMATQSATAH